MARSRPWAVRVWYARPHGRCFYNYPQRWCDVRSAIKFALKTMTVDNPPDVIAYLHDLIGPSDCPILVDVLYRGNKLPHVWRRFPVDLRCYTGVTNDSSPLLGTDWFATIGDERKGVVY